MLSNDKTLQAPLPHTNEKKNDTLLKLTNISLRLIKIIALAKSTDN